MVDEHFERPSVEDVRRILEGIGKSDQSHERVAERLDLSVPAEVTTFRGNTVSAMTREISRFGIGLAHKGQIEPGEVTVRMASESREFEYRVLIEWCHPSEDGPMFLSGGRFLSRDT